MAQKKKKIGLAVVVLLFILYVFIAAQPIPRETILIPRWLSSLGSNYPVVLEDREGAEVPQDILSFKLGNHFGYINASGHFLLNRVQDANLSLSDEFWVEHEAIPQTLEIHNPFDTKVIPIEGGRGYPFFRDGRIFLFGSDQNSIAALDKEGKQLWTYDFSGVLTGADAAAGYFLAGSLDGRVELLDNAGRLIFPPFEPGGSRYSVIAGCALSRDGSRIAVISGIDQQRFLLLERSARTSAGGGGESYRIIYHEFIGGGLRRPVRIAFIDNDNRVAFEWEGGVGIYDINARNSIKLPLKGEIRALDKSGDNRLLFIITAPSEQEKRLVVVRLPGKIIIDTPFKSETSFLGREGPRLYVGGGMTLVSFELGKK